MWIYRCVIYCVPSLYLFGLGNIDIYTYIHIYIIIAQHNYVKLQLYATEDVANDLDVHVVFFLFFLNFFFTIFFL